MKRYFILFFVIILLNTGCKSNNEANNEVNNEVRPIVDNEKTDELFLTKESSTIVVDEVQSQKQDNEELKPINLFPIEELKLGSLVLQSLMLAPDEDATHSIRISFQLLQDCEAPTVIVINEAGELFGEFVTAKSSLQIGDKGNDELLYGFKAIVSNLSKEEKYSFIIHNNEQYSKLIQFETLKTQSTRMAFFGDTQGYKLEQYQNFLKVFEKAEELGKIEIAYIAGDVVDNGDSYEQWEYFNEAMMEYTSQKLFVTAIGNHDVSGSAELYLQQFNYPKNGISGLEERNYFFDLPNARVAVWDTESVSKFDIQGKWLSEIMSDTQKPFKIVLMHRSPYPMAYDEHYIRNLAAIFEGAGIDLVLSGHDHIYSRTTMFEDKLIDYQEYETTDEIADDTTNKITDKITEGVTYIVGGSSTGSKYYDEITGNRYWKQVVYDGNNPVFCLLDIDEGQMKLTAYSVEKDVVQIIDECVFNTLHD